MTPNIRRMQNTDTGSKTQTQLIIGFQVMSLPGAINCSPGFTINSQ